MQPRTINISLVSFPINRETAAVYWSERVQQGDPSAESPRAMDETGEQEESV